MVVVIRPPDRVVGTRTPGVVSYVVAPKIAQWWGPTAARRPILQSATRITPVPGGL